MDDIQFVLKNSLRDLELRMMRGGKELLDEFYFEEAIMEYSNCTEWKGNVFDFGNGIYPADHGAKASASMEDRLW